MVGQSPCHDSDPLTCCEGPSTNLRVLSPSGAPLHMAFRVTGLRCHNQDVTAALREPMQLPIDRVTYYLPGYCPPVVTSLLSHPLISAPPLHAGPVLTCSCPSSAPEQCPLGRSVSCLAVLVLRYVPFSPFRMRSDSKRTDYLNSFHRKYLRPIVLLDHAPNPGGVTSTALTCVEFSLLDPRKPRAVPSPCANLPGASVCPTELWCATRCAAQ